jgi:membrane protein YdbS with pleckstrin-like domain
MEIFGSILGIIVIAVGAICVLGLIIGIIIAPLYIWRHTKATCLELEKIRALLEEIRNEAILHTNRTIPCPSCGEKIRLNDGKGKCESCGQIVNAG